MNELRSRWGLRTEWMLFTALVLTGCWSAYLAISRQYMPQPFFFMVDDTFMGWFNTAWWARDPGIYDTWRTIYPPLSFVIMRVAGIASCYQDTDIVFVRRCDWLGTAVFHATFVLNIILTARVMLKIDRSTALPRSFAISAGMPMLFGLERGNIVLLCYTFVLLGFGPLLRSARLRWIFVGLAVNLKVYLIGTIASQLLRRRWLWFEGTVLAAVGIYLICYAIIGAGTPMELISNLLAYTEEFKPDAVTAAYYMNTFNPLLTALTDPFIPATGLLGSAATDAGALVITIVLRTTQAAIALAAVMTWYRPEVVPPYRVTLLGMAFAMVSTEAGGYTSPMLFLFVFMEPWKGVARPIALVCCYILCLPGDVPLSYLTSLDRESYLFGKRVVTDQYLTLGMFLRPFLFNMIPFVLSLLTIKDVAMDVRTQGWSKRWRFRRDLSLLPGVARPVFQASA